MPEQIIQFAGNDARLGAPTQQLFGVEIEVENVAPAFRNQTIELGETWSTKLDGSLRNNGLEFITLPRTLEQMKQSLRRFYRWNDEFKFGTSIRTSMHVHADMRLYNTEQLRSLVTAVCLVEPLLMMACSGIREESIYCVPFYRVNDDLEKIRNILDAPARRFNGLTRTCKYSALYLEPILRFGTVEFRQAPVWRTYTDAIEWVECINDLITYSVNVNPNTVLSRFAEEGAEDFCTNIFGRQRKQWLRDKASTMGDLHDVFESYDVVRQATMLLTDKLGRKLSEWSPPKLVRGPHAVVAPAPEPNPYRRNAGWRNTIGAGLTMEAPPPAPVLDDFEEDEGLVAGTYEQRMRELTQERERLLREPQPAPAALDAPPAPTWVRRRATTANAAWPLYTWTLDAGGATRMTEVQPPQPTVVTTPGTPATRNAGPVPNAAARRATRRRNQQPRRRT